ncbi:polyphosphate polymerase domain-containing protein [Vallitalea sediminicola]
MTGRHELKYMMNELEDIVLVKRVEKVLKRDGNSNGKGYSITSLYFDNCYNQAYEQKMNGEAIRHKYRIRYYNDDLSYIKLEKKSKINQITKKVSVPLSVEEVEKIYERDLDFLLAKKKYLYHEFYKELKHGLLKPKVIVKYDREAFIHPVGDLRITFDRKIKTANMHTNILSDNQYFIDALEKGKTILEIKFNGVLPDFIRSLIQSGHIMQASSSKYIFSRKYNVSF